MLGSLAGWMFTISLLLILLGIFAAIQWRAVVSSPARQRALPRSKPLAKHPRQVVPLHLAIAALAGRAVKGLRDMRQAFLLGLGSNDMSSNDVPSITADDIPWDMWPKNPEPRTRNLPALAENLDDTPDYVISLGRLEAIKIAYDKGLTPLDLAALQDADTEVIVRARKARIARKVLAKAMGGNYERRRGEIAAAIAEQGEGEA